MKKDKLLNSEIIRAIAALGHTQMLAVGDAGLPVPKGVPVIDLSLTKGVPSFAQVLEAVASELVVESYIYAEECTQANPGVEGNIQRILEGYPSRQVPHEGFKELVSQAKLVIRTGECTSYANIVLVAGVNF